MKLPGYVFCNIRFQFVLVVSFISVSVVNSGYNGDEYGQSSPAPDVEEELHMDFVPTGYLPDSVYRELAWYGILQIQPLYYSTKHKVAARWIWQNTLGRPHVILENSPQATESEIKRGQTLMEESVKWVREQRSAMDVLMENIRAGGNGLTVRTVISSTKKSAYIIQSGKTYECGTGSEPDIDAFRAQSNMHERRCTENKTPKLVPLDMCMDAEFTPVEYSYVDGWSFCMGDGERDSSYKENGDLDCGQKKKVTFSRFLEECAIDKNVVITFEYYGDEPRKDLVRNTTLCTTWDPCRFSYLYRIEVSDNDMPDIPTTTPDPCDTTFCPECVENSRSSEEPYKVYEGDNSSPSKLNVNDDPDISTASPLAENYSAEPVSEGDTEPPVEELPNDVLEWIPTTFDEFHKYQDKALEGGYYGDERTPIYVMRAQFKNLTIPGKLLATVGAFIGYNVGNVSEIRINDTLEIAIPRNGSKLEWVPGRPDQDDYAVPGGRASNGDISFICRASAEGNMIPGRFDKVNRLCLYTHRVQMKDTKFEMLINRPTRRKFKLK